MWPPSFTEGRFAIPRGRIAGLVVAALIVTSSNAWAQNQRSTTVGMPAQIEQLVLPGPELTVKPLEDRSSSMVVRITGTFRHGTDFRYDVDYYGLEPGEFDLKDYFECKDGSSTQDLPSILVEIKPVLPPGQIEPNELKSKQVPSLGGYRTALVVVGIAWLVGLFAILTMGRKKESEIAADGAKPLSLADRLRPIVEDAFAGRITQRQQAELERMLLVFWRQRLSLDGMKAADAIAALRAHDEAGRLLQQLEVWLHRPGDSKDVDVVALLEPYRNLPADALKAEIG